MPQGNHALERVRVGLGQKRVQFVASLALWLSTPNRTALDNPRAFQTFECAPEYPGLAIASMTCHRS